MTRKYEHFINASPLAVDSANDGATHGSVGIDIRGWGWNCNRVVSGNSRAPLTRLLGSSTGAARPASGGNESIKIVSAVDGSVPVFDPKNGLWLVAGQGVLLALGR